MRCFSLLLTLTLHDRLPSIPIPPIAKALLHSDIPIHLVLFLPLGCPARPQPVLGYVHSRKALCSAHAAYHREHDHLGLTVMPGHVYQLRCLLVPAREHTRACVRWRLCCVLTTPGVPYPTKIGPKRPPISGPATLRF
jgi:hypothetical protein